MLCRICFDDTNGGSNKLIDPCACDGSSKYVHQLCLNFWIRMNPEKNAKQCPTCMSQYRFTNPIKEVIPNQTTLTLLIVDKAMFVGFFTHYIVLAIRGTTTYVPITEMKIAQFIFQILFHVSYSINNNVRNREIYRRLLKRSYMPVLAITYLYLSLVVLFRSDMIHCFTLSFIMNLVWREHVRVLEAINNNAQ
jgi:hypothetical protein